MIIQNLIDELREQLPGFNVQLSLYPDDDGKCGLIWVASLDYGKDYMMRFGPDEQAKTPDEALAILRQRLGLESTNTFECPIDYPGCKQNCGNYGCGN